MKKSERLNQEMIFLKGKKSFQLKDLMEQFSISKRTAIRDVQELESLGLALYTDLGRGGSYQLLQQNLLVPIYFSESEIQAIFFAIKALDLVSSTPFDKSYPVIRKKLFETLPENKKQNVNKILEVVSYHHVSPINDVENLSELLESILNSKIISLNYTQFTNQKMNLQIFDLFYRNGLWFCNAVNMENEKWGVFRCDYMEEIIINQMYKPYTKEKMKLFLKNYETEYHDIQFKCRLTEYGKELFLKRHYPNMALKLENNESFIVGSYNNEHLDYMVQYLISLGKHVTVVSPAELKESYLNEIKLILESYS